MKQPYEVGDRIYSEQLGHGTVESIKPSASRADHFIITVKWDAGFENTSEKEGK